MILKCKLIFSPLSSLNSLSLDAPLVCLVWQIALANFMEVDLKLQHHLILGLSVWLCYSADRFTELPLPEFSSAPRYEVFKAFPLGFKIFWSTTLLFTVTLACLSLSVECLLFSLPLLLFCLLNFKLCLYEMTSGRLSFLAKEVRTSAILSWGCMLFPMFETSTNPHDTLVYFISLLLVFFANCLYVSEWERLFDFYRGRLTIIQKNPGFLNGLIKGNYLFLLISGCLWFIGDSPINFFTYVFWVLIFAMCLNLLSMENDKKRNAIDLGYWFVPLILLLIEHAS